MVNGCGPEQLDNIHAAQKTDAMLAGLGSADTDSDLDCVCSWQATMNYD